MAKTWGVRPSQLFGILDYRIALDFDRLHHLRLVSWDTYCAEKRAEAIKDGSGK